MMRILGGFFIAGVLGYGCMAQAQDPAGQAANNRHIIRYNDWVEGIQCFTGGGKARVGAEGQKDRAFRFSLAVQRPGQFRMQGRFGAMAQIFDLSHNSEQWTLYLPQARQVVTGATSESSLDFLNPTDYLQALMPAPIPVGRTGTVTHQGTSIQVSCPPDSSTSPFHRVVDIDVATGFPKRMEIRESTRLEQPLIVVTYSDFDKKHSFPKVIRVEREGAWAKMEFNNWKNRDALDPRRFRINVPHGTEELPPESLGFDFLPVAEDEQ